MSRALTWGLALALGAGVAALVHWVAAAPLLGGYAGAFWAVGVGLTAHNARSIPGLWGRSADWDTTTRLWSGAFGGALALAGTAVIGPQLPVDAELGFALGLFVVGVGLTTANLGIGLALSVDGE